MQRRTGRRFVRRGPGARPSRTWADVSNEFVLSGIAATGSATLIQLQAPASLASLTSDPPEDLTLLRIRGQFFCQIAAGPATWTLALLVQDTTWTPSSTFSVDADKRILWSQTFNNFSNVSTRWVEPDYMQWDIAGTIQISQTAANTVDIAPKVKIEAGKALFLVGYEDVNGGTLDVTSQNMRVLFQRSGRPR